MRPIRVLFVCLGNICRSPLGHGVLEHMARERGLDGRVVVDSCGTGGWHVGEAPNRHSQAVARRHGVDISRQRARQVAPADFETFDWILAMDRSNLADLRRLAEPRHHDRIHLTLDFGSHRSLRDVPDPYYGGVDGFEHVYALVEDACAAFLDHLEATGALS